MKGSEKKKACGKLDTYTHGKYSPQIQVKQRHFHTNQSWENWSLIVRGSSSDQREMTTEKTKIYRKGQWSVGKYQRKL
jgi:hypothetical protein